MKQGQVIQMVARFFGLAFLALGLLDLLPNLLRPRADGGRHHAVDLVLGGAGLAVSRSWEASRAYLIGGAATSAAVGLYGTLGPDADRRPLAPTSSLDRVLHFVLAVAMFQGWVANLADRDPSGLDSPMPSRELI